MNDSKTTLQSTILRLLADPRTDKRMGRAALGVQYFMKAVHEASPPDKKPSIEQITQTLWQLLGRGLVYLSIEQPAPENWKWQLTDSGRLSSQDEIFNPDDPERYLSRIKRGIPDVSDLVLLYAKESVYCYINERYLASTVMLGVSSEAAFIEMAKASVTWLGAAGEKLSKILNRQNESYVNKFKEFRKRVEPRKTELPEDIADNINLTFDSIIDLLRISRNETGHPTGKIVSREDQYISLQMFGRYLEKLYALKTFFRKHIST